MQQNKQMIEGECALIRQNSVFGLIFWGKMPMSWTIFCMLTSSVDPDQTAPRGAV